MKSGTAFSRFVVIVSLLMLVAAGQSQGATVTVVLPRIESKAAGDIKVPVQVKGAEGLGPLQLDLRFDARQLKFVDAAEGSSAIGLFDFNLVEPGRLRLVMTGDPNKPIQGDAELFVVRFQAADSARGTILLNAENVRAWEQTTEAYEMLAAVEPGSINITARSRSSLLIVAGCVAAAVVLLLVVTHFVKGKPTVAAGSATQVASTVGRTQSRFCSSCGAPLPPASQFCSACGKPVGGS